MDTNIMHLNNQISGLNKQNEEIYNMKSKLKNEEEETSSKQLAKISELARIFMAIDNLEERCKNRRGKASAAGPGGAKNTNKANAGLNYEAKQLYFTENKVIQDLKNFDSFSKRQELATSQLQVIARYLLDFKSIIEKFDNPQ